MTEAINPQEINEGNSVSEENTTESENINDPWVVEIQNLRQELRTGISEIKGFILGAATAIVIGIIFLVIMF